MDDFEFCGDLKSAPWTSLETFENPATGRRYEIEFHCPEWTALCPRSGFPDFGTIHIKYQPRAKCIELKSLKLYINSFRHTAIFHEGAVNKILDDFVEACSPWRAEVIGDFNVRGNIKTTVRALYLATEDELSL